MCQIAEILVALFLLIIGYKDWKSKQISCLLLAAMTVAIIALRFIVVKDTIWSTLGGVAIGIFFLALSKCTRESVGYGDSWLISLLGIFLGGKTLLEIVLLATFFASLFSIIYCIRRGWNKKYTVPFVPFLAAAYIGVMFL